jgi:hypothetical protein
MTSVAATVFESGHYERGAAALINSLIASGFSGRVWLGVRGPQPSWLSPNLLAQLQAKSLEVNCVSISTSYDIPNYKPHFLLEVTRREGNTPVITYFDADMIVKCPWSFVEQWSASGIAAVGDENWLVPRSSPMRAQLRELRSRLEVAHKTDERPAPLDIYCNAGFLGLNTKHIGFLELWADLIDAFLANTRSAITSRRAFPTVGPDQDLFNLALMSYGSYVSLMGPAAMDFAPGGDVFSHSTGAVKPWSRPFVRSALQGHPPSKRDAVYLHYSRGPVGRVPRSHHIRRTLEYRVARGIGSLMRRTDY